MLLNPVQIVLKGTEVEKSSADKNTPPPSLEVQNFFKINVPSHLKDLSPKTSSCLFFT